MRTQKPLGETRIALGFPLSLQLCPAIDFDPDNGVSESFPVCKEHHEVEDFSTLGCRISVGLREMQQWWPLGILAL